jgi:protein-tyrosine phosphatase
MMPDVYWILDIAPLRLAIMPRPRGGEWLQEEVTGWASSGIQVAACLLHAYEIEELGIRDEQRYCTQAGIGYRSFPIADRGVPERLSDFLAFTDALAANVQGGLSVAVHCRAGIGRSSLTAAAILLRLGVAAANAFPMISTARGLSVPDTQQQVEWFHMLSKAIAARGV